MHEWRTLLFRSDAAILAREGEVRPREGYVAFWSPNRRHLWGNLLVFPAAPTAENASAHGEASWERAFAREHPDVVQRGFAWDDPTGSPGAIASFLERGYEEDLTAVLEAGALEARPPSLAGASLRLFRDSEDWSRCGLLYADAFGDPRWGSEDELLAWAQDEVRACRRSTERGHALWVGAFVGSSLVGACGIARVDDELARYRFVATAEDAQRRGVCTALLAAAQREAARAFGVRRVLIAADASSPALSVYERAGFRRVETVRAALLLPPVAAIPPPG